MAMGQFSIFHWLIILSILLLPIALVAWLISVARGEGHEVADTWKFRTVIFVVLGVVFPLWFVSLPFFLYLAWRSYKAGKPAELVPGAPVRPPGAGIADAFRNVVASPPPPPPSSQSAIQEIGELHRLLQQGALTPEEFEQEKRKLLTPKTQ